MDHQRDSDWIEPLEATALSIDEEAKAQTPVSLEGDMRLTEKDKILISARRRNAGAPIMGDGGGCRTTPPCTPKTSRPHIRRQQNLQNSILKLSKVRARKPSL